MGICFIEVVAYINDVCFADLVLLSAGNIKHFET